MSRVSALILIGVLILQFILVPTFTLPVNAECFSPLPTIQEISISPTSGDPSTTFTVTIPWQNYPEVWEQYDQEFRGFYLRVHEGGPATTPLITSVQDELFHAPGDASVQKIGLNSIILYGEPGGAPKTYNLNVYLIDELGCNVNEFAPPFSVTSTLDPENTNGEPGLKAGERCNPDQQGEGSPPELKCPADVPCTETWDHTINFHGWVCGGSKYFSQPATPTPPLPQCRNNIKEDGKCTSITTSLPGRFDGLNLILSTDPRLFITDIFGVILSLSGGIAMLLIMLSGYRMMMSRGNPEGLQNARETLTAAIVGLLFIIFSITILELIGIDILHLEGFTRADGSLVPPGPQPGQPGGPF